MDTMLSNQFDPQIQNHIDQKTKPLGALGEFYNEMASFKSAGVTV
jgi:hypothetical protein